MKHYHLILSYRNQVLLYHVSHRFLKTNAGASWRFQETIKKIPSMGSATTLLTDYHRQHYYYAVAALNCYLRLCFEETVSNLSRTRGLHIDHVIVNVKSYIRMEKACCFLVVLLWMVSWIFLSFCIVICLYKNRAVLIAYKKMTKRITDINWKKWLTNNYLFSVAIVSQFCISFCYLKADRRTNLCITNVTTYFFLQNGWKD